MIDVALVRGAELLVWVESHGLIASGVVAALMVPGMVCCWAARRGAAVSRQTLARIDQRLTQIATAVDLLTDTTESSLKSAFAEIERLSEESTVRLAHRAALPARVQAAARDGRSLREIARSEGVSESEVRLRLRLSGELPEEKTHTTVQ